MKQFLGAGLMLLIAVGDAAADDSKLYTNPTLPSPEVLDRLNMRMAWRVNVPMGGRRDGFVSIQINAGQVIAATRDGVVAAYDAETGREAWKIVVGKAGDETFAPTFNSRSVLVVRGVFLYAIDRNTGRLEWQYRLPFGVSTAPVADERQIYLSGINTQVTAFDLPSQGEIGATATPGLRVEDDRESRYQKERDRLILKEIHPDVMWSAVTSLHLDYTPLMTPTSLFYATPDGYTFVYGKYPLSGEAVEAYRVQLDKRFTAAPGVYDEMAYLPASDTNLYAVNIPSGKSRWRYAAGNTITRRPFVTDTDVYVTVDRKGLVRLKRESGDPMWKLPMGRNMTTEAVAEANQVLAVNNKFVYATDTAGRLRVLDRATGKQLSYYEPFREYNFPVHNETSDRLLLAANNGLILCLHDREYEKPLIHRKYEMDRNSPEILAKTLKEKLARKISDKGADAMPLADVLEGFKRRYGLTIFLSEKAFADAGIQSIRDKTVAQPRVDNMEVGDVLKGILAKVDASYAIVGDTIHVLPKNAVAIDKNPLPNPMGDMNPPPNVDEGVRKFLSAKMDPIGVDKLSVSEFIETMALRANVKMNIDDKAFKAAGINPEEVLKKEVMYPKTKGIQASQLLREIFDQVKGDYEVRGDTIYLVPKK